MKVIAFDPGGTTGYCILAHDGSLIDQGQIPGADAEQGHKIQQLLKTHKRDSFVVIESYRVFAQALEAHINSRVQPVEMIGRIKATCDGLGTHYKEQPPMLKKFFTTKRLKWYGCYARGQVHANDAACHALYYLVFTLKVLGLPPE